MKKRAKIAVIAVFAFIVLFILYPLLPDRYTDRDMKWHMGREDLRVMGYVVRKLMVEEKLTIETWREINRMDDLAPLLEPQLEQGIHGLNDPWGNLYQLDKREQNEHLIVTIRSSKERKSEWYELKNKVLGIEITITKQDWKVVKIKDLWLY